MNTTTTGQLKNSSYEKVRRAMHDIQSPLASLKMMQLFVTNLSEQDKELLSNSTQRITRIVDSLNGFLNDSNENPEIIESINIHSVIKKILIEKKNEYHNLGIEFFYNNQSNSENLSISGSMGDFERMLSNLINNSVDACDSKTGKITVTLESDTSYLHLVISDNGKGMSAEVLEKLRNSISITHGKKMAMV